MSERCKDVSRLILSGIGIVVGVSAFITFCFVYGNLHAGVWGLISGVLAAVCFQLNYLHFKHNLDNWHSIETLSGMRLLGTLGLLAGTFAFAWYLFSAIYFRIPLIPITTSAYIAAVWAFLTAKWGLMLKLTARMYTQNFLQDNPRLIRL